MTQRQEDNLKNSTLEREKQYQLNTEVKLGNMPGSSLPSHCEVYE